MRQLIDNFYWYIAVKGNLEKQKITTLMGKITAAALVGTRAPKSQKHNNTQNCLPQNLGLALLTILRIVIKLFPLINPKTR